MPLWMRIILLFSIVLVAQPIGIFWVTGDNYSLEAYSAAINSGSVRRQIALIILALWAVVELASNTRRMRINGILGRLVLWFLFLSIASITWADDPALSVKRVAVLMILAFSALAVAERLTLEDITAFAFWGTGIALVLGWGNEIVQGVFYPLDRAYRFAGGMHPNTQGVYCGFLSISGITLARSAKRHRYLFALGAIMGFTFLILTKSRASVAAYVVSIGVYLAITSRRSFYRGVWAAWSAVVIALAYILLYGEAVKTLWDVVLMGRGEDVYTPTLMGRTELWQTLLAYVYQRPILGYGYGSFWTVRRLSSITQEQGWIFGSAHSGYLEMLLGIGLVGASTYVAILVKGLARSIAIYRRSHAVGFSFGAAAIVFVLIAMVLQTVPLEPHLPMFSCMAIVAKLSFLPGDNYNKVPSGSVQHELHLRGKAIDPETGRVL